MFLQESKHFAPIRPLPSLSDPLPYSGIDRKEKSSLRPQRIDRIGESGLDGLSIND
jgi:hypothetical protein